jgi:hypothetical protein
MPRQDRPGASAPTPLCGHQHTQSGSVQPPNRTSTADSMPWRQQLDTPSQPHKLQLPTSDAPGQEDKTQPLEHSQGHYNQQGNYSLTALACLLSAGLCADRPRLALSPSSSQVISGHIPIPLGTPKDTHLHLLAPYTTCIVHSNRDSLRRPRTPTLLCAQKTSTLRRPYGGPPHTHTPMVPH